LKILDYLFFRLYKFYDRFSYGSIFEQPPLGLAVALLTLTQLFTIYIVASGLENLGIIKSMKTSMLTDLIIMGTVFTINLYRYTKIKTVDELLEQWGHEDTRMKTVGTVLTIMYVFGSLIAFLYVTGFFKQY
jgi:hypothetical protein